MKAKELRDFPDDELIHHIETVRKDLFGRRFQHATGELENTAGLGTSKRELARALTVARERQLEVEYADFQVELRQTPVPAPADEAEPAAETEASDEDTKRPEEGKNDG